MEASEIFRAAGFKPANEKGSLKGSSTCEESANTSKAPDHNAKPQPEYYDEAYFDSDSEDGREVAGGDRTKATGEGHQTRKVKMMTDEDLLFDPNADSDDEKWMRQRIAQERGANDTSEDIIDSTTLACPLCMTPVCHDCQQHELYETQFRAMFFENCTVDTAVQLKYPVQKPPNRKKRKALTEAEQDQDGEDDDAVFWPVRCDTCTTQVGVMDAEEVVHFFNVIASCSMLHLRAIKPL
ncbi:E2F-associated phosphoprotein-domain-containing protein [Fimicolochytrium jonesii]|uniref:E2F-associated phosphoprotein-domain-containing protein n=1 Tax=Fimicolochytrium jonesii TaxID=1396493 RepID=UPI0022FE73C8|nr:E2F-associated phosphoprotein-domain-containing protein [Fimicolochytrium jonesii]KAI8826894.1 E2F-associated phosphoprotein-domain-containing protein [Fimicolochytrium jonesii]